MRNIKLIFTVTVLLVIFFLSADHITLYKKGSFKFIFEADKDNAYSNLLFVKKVKGESELNKLIECFLSITNPDLLTKEVAIRYIRENKKVEFLGNLKSVQKNFQTINPDSSWSVQIEPNRFRSASLKNAVVVSVLNETINELNNN
jgi:uncharacterized protein (DUF1015 family)